MVLEGFGVVVEVFGVVWKGLEGLGVAQGITLDGRGPPLQKQQGGVPPFFEGRSGGRGTPLPLVRTLWTGDPIQGSLPQLQSGLII